MAKADLKKKGKALVIPATKEDKKKALESALAQIEKNYGKGAVIKLGANTTMQVDSIPTGSMGLDMALGIGGVPKGRIVELYGPESSGKTTVALHVIAEAQKLGGEVAFVDVEHALDPKYAAALGVDVDNLLVSQPDSGEQALEIMEALVRSGAIDVVVLDSVAALTTKAEIDGNMGDSNVGQLARLMSQAMRKLTPLLSKTNCVAIFINQIREKIGVIYGSPETTPGGRALKFYSSVIIDVRKGDVIKDGTDVIGSRTKIKVKKNKLAPPFKECEFDIIYGKGISRVGEVLDMAVELDIVNKSGAWFSFDGQKLGQGRDNAKKTLESNEELMKEIEKRINENKDALEIVAVSAKKKSKLELAAEKAAENSSGDISQVIDSTETDDYESLDPVVNAEDDFEEFTPAD
ncbi:MAG: recombinase RecA [Oscillospiraceae bacterium]|nr:recombinase RecA [Oscillospiraceae bacterium]